MSTSGIWIDVFPDTSKTDTMLSEVEEIAYKEADESKLLWRGAGLQADNIYLKVLSWLHLGDERGEAMEFTVHITHSGTDRFENN